jgi:two-component system, sensor histidine kinase ChiS
MATVVSAEDDPDIRALIVRALRREHEVVAVDNGRAGVDKAIQLLPDVVLLDVDMPVMNGLDACRAIRAHDLTRHIPVIIISGSIDPPFSEVHRAGGTATLPKPFSPTALREVVAIIAGHHHEDLHCKQALK